MNPEIKNRVERKLEFLKRNKDSLVIDADTHISDVENLPEPYRTKYLGSDNYYHGRPISAEDLLTEMRLARVDMALVWQNPAVTLYGDDQKVNFESLLQANRYLYESDEKHPGKFIPGGWTDPKNLGVELAMEMAEICIKEFGFLFVKMNPAQNRYRIDNSEVQAVFNHIIEMGGIPAFHFGGDTTYTPSEGLEKLAMLHPDHPLLAIHMGGGGPSYMEGEEHYNKARELGLRYPNIKFVQSAKRDTHIESDFITYQIAGKPFSKNIFCGSDAPYGRQTWNFGGYRAMFESLIDGKNHTDKRLRQNPGLFTPDATRDFMGRNFAELLINGYQRVITGKQKTI
jgi:predicted TIM-barrel fold metal-dependent hydrolase